MEKIALGFIIFFGILIIIGIIIRLGEILTDSIRHRKDLIYLRTHDPNKGCSFCKNYFIDKEFCMVDSEDISEFDPIKGLSLKVCIDYNRSQYKIRNEIGACPLYIEGKYSSNTSDIEVIQESREWDNDYD